MDFCLSLLYILYKLKFVCYKNQILSTGRKYSFSGTMTEDDFLNCLLWAFPNQQQRLFVPSLYFPLVYPTLPAYVKNIGSNSSSNSVTPLNYNLQTLLSWVANFILGIMQKIVRAHGGA